VGNARAPKYPHGGGFEVTSQLSSVNYLKNSHKLNNSHAFFKQGRSAIGSRHILDTGGIRQFHGNMKDFRARLATVGLQHGAGLRMRLTPAAS
jgi:hypothetical protein